MISVKMNLFKSIIILIILYFISLQCMHASSLLINEVMFDPIEDDRYFEWIECYNPTNKSIDLNGWNISDNYATDILEPDPLFGNNSMILSPNGFCLITDQGSHVLENHTLGNNTLFLTVDDAAIGNGLGNTADKLILTDNNNKEVDAIEWGQDYDDINGTPITEFTEGYSIVRRSTLDTNDTFTDFSSTQTTTPGQINMVSTPGTITIKQAPQYIAKPFSKDQFSIPISVYIELNNFSAYETYEIKASIQDTELSNKIASQTWDGDKWQYSDRYVLTIITNSQGCWSGWIHLRFNKEYAGFSQVIKNNNSGLLQIKVRHNQETDEYSEEIKFLDMDNSTANAIKGGCLTHILTNNELNQIESDIFCLQKKDNTILGINSINNYPNSVLDEIFIKIAVPVGSNYSLFNYNNDNQYMLINQNISIKQGFYDVSINGESSFILQPKSSYTLIFTLFNTGQFDDTYIIEEVIVPTNWNIILKQKKVDINAGKNRLMKATISPSNIIDYTCPKGEIELLFKSSFDPEVYVRYHLSCEIKAPDLTIPEIKTYDENGNEKNQIKQGKIIRIKAYYKNHGNENASDSFVSFYLDEINESHLLCKKAYEDIGTYQKYPSFYWDTSTSEPGNHTIFVIADEDRTINEMNELNNQNQCTIYVINTSPSDLEKQILISEFYFDNHPGIPNEYICLYNPTNTSLNLSQWYITTKPDDTAIDQNKIIFSKQTEISSRSHMYITQNASAFYLETGFYPDFEYEDDSLDFISQLNMTKTVVFSDEGSIISLKNPYNHTIDQIIYGIKSNQNSSSWIGPSIKIGQTGQIYKRKQVNDYYIDSNCFEDWNTIRYYFIGQSQFPITVFQGKYNMTLFVSPDNSYHTICSELRNASSSILINMYEFTNNQLCNELMDLLRRNISVKILLEKNPVGGIDDAEWVILHRLSYAGADINFIIQDTSKNIYNRYPFNHAKYVLIDNKTTIVESCNFATYGIPINPTFGNREWGIIIHDKIIASFFHSLFNTDCNSSRLDIESYDRNTTILPDQCYIENDYISYDLENVFLKETLNVTAKITPIISPDTSLELLLHLIDTAKESIYIQQLYIYTNWTDRTSPLVSHLIEKANQGLEIKIIMNYNPIFQDTNIKCNYTKNLLKIYGMKVKFIYTNDSKFSNVHNKGMIIDNETVLISSINWNENSIMRNRETGVIIQSKEVAQYYLDVFFYDWNVDKQKIAKSSQEKNIEESDNTIYIVSLFTCTFIIIAHDWRKRKWA